MVLESSLSRRWMPRSANSSHQQASIVSGRSFLCGCSPSMTHMGGRQDGPAPECPQSILERRKFVVDELCRRFAGSSLLVAELHREMGDFDECIRIANEPTEEADTRLAQIVSIQIIAHAKAKDTAVFKLLFPE